MKETALVYALSKYFIVPLKDQTPLTDFSSNDIDQIGQWWQKWPGANIGLDLKKNGICALEILPRRMGDISLKKMKKKFGTLPETVMAKTWDNKQLYFFKNLHGTLVPKQFKRGVEVKNDIFIIMPPRLYQSGKQWIWVQGHELGKCQIADLPSYLIVKKRIWNRIAKFRNKSIFSRLRTALKGLNANKNMRCSYRERVSMLLN